MFTRILAALRRDANRRAKHKHDWDNVGYGGAGWCTFECTGCEEKEIG